MIYTYSLGITKIYKANSPVRCSRFEFKFILVFEQWYFSMIYLQPFDIPSNDKRRKKMKIKTTYFCLD